MKTIKFKCWDKELNRFVIYEPHISIDLNGNIYNLQNGEGRDRYELVQFTGLLDRRGKEIYEGDILKYDDINWGYGGDYDKENDGYLRVTVPPIDEMLKDDNFEWFRLVFYEVIGNIYENPELLKA